MDTAVIVVCAALAAAGVVCVVRWGADESRRAFSVRRLALLFPAGMLAGVLAAGTAGRLVMRLLAVTSPAAEGQVTEGQAVIGEITPDGTLGFLIFVGVPAGLLAALIYALAGSLLPCGRTGGGLLGLLVLVLVGSRIDPLRSDNFDFNLVGPPWLALLAFTALAVLQGMTMWAVAARLDLPPLPLRGRALAAGRAVAAAVTLVALPGLVAAMVDIMG